MGFSGADLLMRCQVAPGACAGTAHPRLHDNRGGAKLSAANQSAECHQQLRPQGKQHGGFRPLKPSTSRHRHSRVIAHAAAVGCPMSTPDRLARARWGGVHN
jgi:hypothetical protein